MTLNEPSIIWQDKNLVAVCKPFGMPSQNDPSEDLSVLAWCEQVLKRELHLLHRLDRPTGGLILLSKTKRGAAELNRQFETREVKKTYLGIVSGSPEQKEGELSHHIAKLPGKNFVRAYDKKVRHSKPAQLTYRVVEEKDGLSLLEIFPHTGRRHQIRAQLRTIKLSLLGDLKYGKSKPLDYPGLALWAHQLVFQDLGGEQRTLSVHPPEVSPWATFLSSDFFAI